jgi:CheY-like chemotaxis protein
MTDMLQRSIGPSISIETRFPLVLPKTQSDPNQLESALLNLVVNARDAMPDGGSVIIAAQSLQITKDAVPGLNAGRYVCLSVQDHGEGMDAETLANAATPFFTTKGIGKGTGLGLSMVQGLMAQSGGKLLLKSVKGEGTMAELWLPQAEQVVQGEQEPVAEEPGASIKQLKVLAVDDDALVLMNTVLMLEDLGHSVIEAHSGDEALGILQSSPDIDVVITDHAMPGMTGVQLSSRIAANWPNIRMVLATGYAELPSGSDSQLLRLAKPFTQSQLAAILAKSSGK